MLGAMIVRDRSLVVAAVVLATATGSAACRSCRDDANATPADASAPAADAMPSVRYAPTRSAPNDSPEPLSVVESTLSKLRPQLNVCYRAASKDVPTLSGTAIVAVTIGVDGHVTEVATESQTGLDASMMACVLGALRGAVFPPPPDGGSNVVKVPLSFRPPRDPGH